MVHGPLVAIVSCNCTIFSTIYSVFHPEKCVNPLSFAFFQQGERGRTGVFLGCRGHISDGHFRAYPPGVPYLFFKASRLYAPLFAHLCMANDNESRCSPCTSPLFTSFRCRPLQVNLLYPKYIPVNLQADTQADRR